MEELTDQEFVDIDDKLYDLVYKYIPSNYELINANGQEYWEIRNELVDLVNMIRVFNK